MPPPIPLLAASLPRDGRYVRDRLDHHGCAEQSWAGCGARIGERGAPLYIRRHLREFPNREIQALRADTSALSAIAAALAKLPGFLPWAQFAKFRRRCPCHPVSARSCRTGARLAYLASSRAFALGWNGLLPLASGDSANQPQPKRSD